MSREDLHQTCVVDVKDDSPFTIYNLPYGVFQAKGKKPGVGVAIGDKVIDMAALYERGVLQRVCSQNLFLADTLNPFMKLGQDAWKSVRANLQAWLTGEIPGWEKAQAGLDWWPMAEVELLMPVSVGDYTDFYSGEEHAANVGRMFRPNADPLLPNWKHLPVAYHGRSSSIICGGTPVRRPHGQYLDADGNVVFGPSEKLDYEVELGFVIGTESILGEPVSTSNALKHVFGVVLLNDLSARDIQRWEYQPLGPFLGKNFATPISSWVVPMEALEPFRIKGPTQEVPVLPYLEDSGAHHWDIELSMELEITGKGRHLLSNVSSKNLYWSLSQQIAHHTINGCNLKPGDILATGTISGKNPLSWGSLLERTKDGKEPLFLGDEQRAWLEDGDVLLFSGRAGEGEYRIGWGDLKTTILPPVSLC